MLYKERAFSVLRGREKGFRAQLFRARIFPMIYLQGLSSPGISLKLTTLRYRASTKNQHLT